uniref:FERM domain-containing protein n=1 Tax=Caenorhabditis tropicalis TaxID=1561998 RepID=A0A1I7TKX3_9PELO
MGTDRDPGDQKPAGSQPRDPKMAVARVLLPDGAHKEFEVNKNADGEALFHQLIALYSIEEREYFSLCFYEKETGIRHWLYNDKPISKQIRGLPWEFSFEVKFYPTTPTTIVNDHARYFLFLQLRRDLLTGRLPAANPETYALLGSFISQMEFGDAPSQMTDAYERFIVDSKLVPSSHANPETFTKIAELHRELRGRTTGEAEAMFLDHCKHLPLYGIHIFKVVDKDKKDTDIGIGAAGINVYQNEQTVHTFTWQNIVKIGYKRTYFSIKVKAGILGKDEKTAYFKLPSYLAAKRVWKNAVEHHTFFRLIQPEEKPQKSFFHFGSQRFRFSGRTQFQTKMASQMFDKPSTVDRAPSAMSQPIASAEDQKLQTLNLTDSELEQRQFERYRRALTPKSYTRPDDDAISTSTFAKYSRPSTLLVVNTSSGGQQDLSYSPRDDSSNYSSAAYYLSERSSLRTPSSAYYPPSEYTSPTSPVYYEGQHSGEYHVQMRQTASTSTSGARRNLFGRASDARSSKASRDSVRLVSFHEPADPNAPMPNMYPTRELPEIPIERIVQVYHSGHEQGSPQRQRAEVPYGFGNYTPRNGVSHVDNLQPDGEMDQQPIKFYVDVRHSGASRRDATKRLSHPGKEEINEKLNPKNYEFPAASPSDPLHRTELSREIEPANIHQYTRRYHATGGYNELSDPPQYRLITHVHPLVVSSREDSRNGQSSSNVTATISQREQVVSTKVRRESPDADRRVRLSASVDRSGNVTDTTEEMARSATTTSEVTTTTTTVVTSTVEKKQKKPKIPPSSKESSSQETRSRFGGFFTKKRPAGYPESSEFSGEMDTTHRTQELESSHFKHPEVQKKTKTTIVTSSFSTEPSSEGHQEKKRSLVAVETPEVPKKYRLIARTRHEGEEDVVEKPEAYPMSSELHEGPVEDIHRQSELDEVPFDRQAGVEVPAKKTVEKKQKKCPKKVPAVPEEPETKEVRLIARIRSEPKEQQEQKEKKPKGTSKFGFFSRSTKKTSEDLETTEKSHEFEPTQTPTSSPTRFALFGRIRHEGEEEIVEKPDPYGFASTSYEGPLEETARQSEIDEVPITDYSNVKEIRESWTVKKTPEKKQKKTKKTAVPAAPVEQEEPEKKEIRLIAYEGSSKFGFFSRSTKTKPGYPETSDSYTGEVDTTDREHEFEDSPLERKPTETAYTSKNVEAYQPSEGVTEAPAAYGFPSTSYDGPLETTVLERDLEHSIFPTTAVAVKKSKKSKKVVSVSKQEPETSEVRLVARVLPEEPIVPEKTSSKSKFGIFKKKTTETKYPETTFTGQFEDTHRTEDLEDIPLSSQISTTRIISETDPVVSHEKKRYRLLARLRHDGEEDVVEKPEAYGFATDVYEGPLDETARQNELDHSQIREYSDVKYDVETFGIEKAAPEKKQKKVKASKKISEPVEPETKEVRLIARVVTEREDEQVTEPAASGKKPKKESSKTKLPAFGFFSRTTKTTSYPETSEAYTGELDTTERIPGFDSRTLDITKFPDYAPKQLVAAETPEVPAEPEKKRYRLIARWRHEGDEEVVEKPETYAFSPDVYDGPLDEIAHQSQLDEVPIRDYSDVKYKNEESWNWKPTSPATLEKKQKKVKSPKKEKVEEPVEPEKKEIRLIARIKSETEEELVASDLPEKDRKLKKGDSKSKIPEFGFFHRTSSASHGYPETSEVYTGDLHTTEHVPGFDSKTLNITEFPEYAPKQLVAEAPEVSTEPEKKRYRLIARWRHEGEEDVVEKPNPYAFAPDVYEGPLDEIAHQSQLDDVPINDYSDVKYKNEESWNWKPSSPVATLEKKQKKMKSPKKEKVEEPVEPETKEVRLIARIKSEPEEELVSEPVVKDKKPKKESSKTKLPAFGFFSRTTKTTDYPETSEAYTGDLDTTNRDTEFEGPSFKQEIPNYLPENVVVEAVRVAPHSEKKRYRLVARLRHEGEEEVTEKPEAYKLPSDVYDGPLEEIAPGSEVGQLPIGDYSEVKYKNEESWNWKPVPPAASLEKKQKKVKSLKKEKIEEPETREVRLIARVKTEPEDEQVTEPVVKEKKPKKEGSKFGFFSRSTRTTETTGYPETSEAYTGELDTTERIPGFDSNTLDITEFPEYDPKQLIAAETPEVPAEPEKKRYRLIARWRHEEEEDVVEKPETYAFASDVYEGPLDEIAHQSQLDEVPIRDYSDVKYKNEESWNWKPTSPPATLEKKVKYPKKEKIEPPVEPEKKEIRLIAYVKPEPEEELASEQVVKEKKPKKEGSSKFGFFSRSTKTTKPGYPETSEAYTGELDTTDRDLELESSPYVKPDAGIPSEADEETGLPKFLTEKKRYRLIARFRHEGEEDVVEKPDPYAFNTVAYDGPLDDIHRVVDLDEAPLGDYADLKTRESWKVEQLTAPIPTLEKKQKKAKSPKKEKVAEPVEPGTREVRLIARIKTEPEEELFSEPVVKEKKPKKEGSKSKLPTFGFFSRSTKTTKTTGYPETSEPYTGDLDTTERIPGFDSNTLNITEFPEYTPKQLVAAETPEVPAESEKKRYRLIARFRHEGEEEVVEKPNPYGFAPDDYEGPLDEIAHQSELDEVPIGDYSDVKYKNEESWNWKPTSPPATLEKKQKKVKSPKKEKIEEPEEPETREVRLIARVKSETEEELLQEPVPKKKNQRKETANRKFPLLVSSIGHKNHRLHTSRLLNRTLSENRLYRLIARWRHEGEEDVLEKPDPYAFSPDVYEGPLDETVYQSEVDEVPIRDYSEVKYKNEDSWNWKPVSPAATLQKKQKKIKSPKKEKVEEPEEPETREVRLIARIKSETEETLVEPTVKQQSPQKEGSKFGFFSRSTKTTKTTGYPETSEHFSGELEATSPTRELDETPFQHDSIPAYSPKKDVIDTPVVPEKKRYRLIARWRHEGEEEVVEKPDPYAFAPDVYEGPLDEIAHQSQLDDVPIHDYSEVKYKNEESWNWKPTSPPATLEKKQKKSKSLKKEKIEEPVEPETREVRLIARIKTEPEEELVAEPVVKEKKPKKEESKSKLPTFGFFRRTSKTTQPAGYPETSEAFTGELDTTELTHEMEESLLETKPAYSPVRRSETPEDRVITEKKKYRLIARYRHDGHEDVVEKPEFYGFSPEMYDGPLDDTLLQSELEQKPLKDHCEIKELEEVTVVEKPIKPSRKEKVVEPVEPETREVRLIARVKTEPEDELVSEPAVKEKKPKKESSKFGFFSRSTKTAKTTGYPETSEAYTGDLDTTERIPGFDSNTLDITEFPEYAPKQLLAAETPEVPAEPEKKRYRLIARWRHEGEEDVLEKPNPYAFAPDVYEGPLDEIAHQSQLDDVPIRDYSDVEYKNEDSWNWKPVSPVATLEKKIKSPKKVEAPVEPEKKEIRLIAYVKPEPEQEPVAEPATKQKKPKKESSKTKLPAFGFFSRTTKTTGYPETSEAYTGDLDTTERVPGFDSNTLDITEFPEYAPKQLVVETPEVPAEPENVQYRIFVRIRHEGEEDVVEKPNPYGFAPDVYEGPLDEISHQSELDEVPIRDYSDVKYKNEDSWNWKPSSPVATLEKKQKKVKSPKKEKIEEPVEPEKKEIRLIAYVKPEPEDESIVETIKEKKPKKEGSKFGFFSRSNKATKPGYPETSDAFTGDLDTTAPTDELETIKFKHKPIAADIPEVPAEPEKKRYRLIARWRHEGEEDVLEKPDPYAFAPDVYEGPLDEIAHQSELDEVPIRDYSDVKYKNEDSWNWKPVSPAATLEKKQKKIKSPKKEKVEEPEEPETREVRLIARVKTEPEDEQVAEPVVKEKKPKREATKHSAFGFFSRTTKTSKTTGYPETSEAYTGDLDTTERIPGFDSNTLDITQFPDYAPKQLTTEEAPETPAEPEKKRYRLIARFRHDGDEEVVEKPDPYAFTAEVYEGPLDEIAHQSQLDDLPISDYSDVKYKNEDSWNWKPVSPVATLEKKVKSPKKEKVEEPVEPEKKEIRLVARVKSEPEEEPSVEPVVKKEKKPKKEGSKSKLPAFGFFSRTTKTTGYPETSEAYTGELDTTVRIPGFDSNTLDITEFPEYAPKQLVAAEAPEVPAEPEKKYTKPNPYSFAPDVYEGPLDEIAHQSELDEVPIGDYSEVKYKNEDSWNWKPTSPPATLEKKQKKVKSPKKEKIEEPEEPETREVRLIARIKSETEEELVTSDLGEKDKKLKKGDSKSKIPGFGFFHRTSSASHGYPETSEAYTGDLHTTEHVPGFDSKTLDITQFPEYAPKQLVASETPEVPAEPEKKRYRLIARWRHEGEEEVVEKPDPYAFAPDVYEGPLDEIAHQSQLDDVPINDYSDVKYRNEDSWNWKPTPTSPVATLEKKQKKNKSAKKEKVEEPEEPETREVRLIARIKSEPEEELVSEPVVKEKKPKKEGTSKVGFFSKTTKTKTTGYPETSDAYTGDLDTTDRSRDIEDAPLGKVNIPAYSPKQLTTDEPSIEPEKPKYRLIARFRHEGEEDIVEKPDPYAFNTDSYAGHLEEISRENELDQTPIVDHSVVRRHEESSGITDPSPVTLTLTKKKTKKPKISEPEEPTIKEARLIARIKAKSEPEPSTSEVKKHDKSTYAKFGFISGASKPTMTSGYPVLSRAYIGRIERTDRTPELAETPYVRDKPETEIAYPKKPKRAPVVPAVTPVEKIQEEPVEPEKKEIRLIARIKTEPEDVAERVVKKKKPKKEGSKFGFFSRSTKTTKSGYPDTSEAYTGDLDTTAPTEFETTEFKHPIPEHAPRQLVAAETPEVPAEPEKKRYRLNARWRHEGEDEVVEKPDPYAFTAEVYEGPLDEIAHQSELDEVPIRDYSDVKYKNEESWNWKPTSPPATLEKKQKKIKSPKKIEEPVEPEKKEIRLIAYVKSEPEQEPVAESAIKQKKPKKESSKSKLPAFGFFSRTTKTTGYPETSEAYTGELDTTERIPGFDSKTQDITEFPEYAPKQLVVEAPEASTEPEKKRYRLIARFRHEGEEEVVEKPNPYGFASDVYEGPLDEIAHQSELDEVPIGDYSDVKYKNEDSWNWKPTSPPATLEKKQKKIKSPKKEEPEEPETKEIRLVARVKSEPEEEPSVEPVVKKEKKPKKEGSKFGFFGRSSKPTTPEKTETEPTYEGPLDSTIRSDEFESIPFDRSQFVTSTPVQVEQITTEAPEEKKTSRFSWFARWRHEGDEDVVEKPDPYAFTTEVYEGPLDDLYPHRDVDLAELTDYSTTYDYKPYVARKPVKEKVKTPEPTPEPTEVKLVARIQPLEHEESPESTEKASPVKDRSRTSSFNIFHRHSKHHGYPETTPIYEGHLDVTGRAEDVEKTPFKTRTDYPEYSPKKEPELPPEPPQQSRLHRLIARWRHEGEEDVVEKPDPYAFKTEVYEGPLEDLGREDEVDETPLKDHSEIYDYAVYSSKKPKSPMPSKKVEETPEPETREVKLLTRVKSEEPEEEVPEETTPSKPFHLRLLDLTKRTVDLSEYPETSPIYEGPLDLTSRSVDMEELPYLHGETPRYSPKVTPVRKIEKSPEPAPPVEIIEKKKYRLIARFRHEGDEDLVEKPDAYAHSTEVYTGPLDEMHKKEEVEEVPIHDFADAQYDGESWNKKLKASKLVARVPPQQEESKKEAFRFRLFSKSRSAGYPPISKTYEGPIFVTKRNESIDHLPMALTRSYPVYSPRKREVTSVERSSEETPPKHYRLIARIRHEGEEDVIEKPDAYGFTSDVYEGPLDETILGSELDQHPLRDFSDVKYDSMRIEKRQKKPVEVSESEQDDEQENVAPTTTKQRFSFLRTQQKRVSSSSYPSTSYSGPLETTNLNLDLENIPLTVPVQNPVEQEPRKYRLIHRIRHAGEETEIPSHKLHPKHYSFPVSRYSGPLEMTSLDEEVAEVPLTRFTRVYHSGSSSGYIWKLLNDRKSRDMDEPKGKDVKLIARVLPMKKTSEAEEKPLTKEEQEIHDAMAKSAEQMDTSRTLTSHLNAINYIPSSLTYHAPRPARIEGHTEDGDCYVEVRHERRAEVQLEPAYVLRETSQRSHAYLSTATAYFSGASASSASTAAPAPAGSTSHSVVVPSFVGSVSEDETGLHHFSWTPQQMSPQPERMSLLARLGFKRDKNKKKDKKSKSKKGETETSGETSDSEHDEKREFAVVEYEPESGQPYTTVSTWQETSDLPEQVEVYTDENGRQITRTVKSSQVKHTVQTQSFQNYIVDGDQVPVGVVDVERSREQLTPLGQKASSSSGEANGATDAGIVETQTRTMTYEAQGGADQAPPGWAEQGLGEYVSSKSVTQGNRTIETITYKTEKDGVVETHVEHRVTIHSDGDIDHDAELSQAILEATQMNPDMVVEKIEVRQETTQ